MRLIQRDPNKGYLDCNLWVPKSQINVDGTKSALTFPIFDRQSVRSLELWKEAPHHLILPREFFESTELQFPVVDCRPTGFPQIAVTSRIKLDHQVVDGQLVPTGKTTQQQALHALLQERGGILQLACGKGKTVIFLELIARLKVPTLIIIDNTQLLSQWKEEIARHLDVPGGVGMIGDGEFDWKKSVVLATYHTIANRADTLPEEVRRWFGLIGWDEGHHIAAPTFSKGADLFYGKRIALTATPVRDDGAHVVYNFHIGKVLYKDLIQDLRPRIYFKWTGMGLDGNDPITKALTEDVNGELHVSKLATYFGQWSDRLMFILDLVNEAIAEDRKVLVLSNSIDELINLFALWTGRPLGSLYTDIPAPTKKDVGRRADPLELTPVQLRKTKKTYGEIIGKLKENLSPPDQKRYEKDKASLERMFEQFECWQAIDKIVRKNQTKYLQALLSTPSNAGIMIHRVKPEIRTQLLKTKQLVFAISKYGREGLDSPDLDTIIASEPMSSRNGLQQFMGRVLRKKQGKKSSVVVFLEDDIGPMIGMCKKLRQHLREWPIDEGGPYEYENIGHPSSYRMRGSQWVQTQMTFGQ